MLPKLDVPIYELTLISSGKKIRFRPFLVKEQKLLLMISQGEDNNNETVNVVKQILKNCLPSHCIGIKYFGKQVIIFLLILCFIPLEKILFPTKKLIMLN